MKYLMGFVLKLLNPNSQPHLRWSFGRQDVVIYGNRFSSELRTIIPSRTEVRVIDPYLRTEVFVREFALSFLSWSVQRRRTKLMDIYFERVLRVAQPKLVLTCVLANLSFFRVRSGLNPSDKTRFLVFQTGPIWLDEAPSEFGLRRGDMLFALTENYAKAWISRRGGAEVLALGSIASLLRAEHESKDDSIRVPTGVVGYISNWRPPQLHEGRYVRYKRTDPKESVPYEHFFSPEMRLLPLLLKTLNQDLNLTLEILGAAAEETRASVDEKLFYEKILGSKNGMWGYQARPTSGGNYQRLRLYDLLFATDSSLALEALSMGYLVIFLEVGEACDVRIPLGYPNNLVRKVSESLLAIENKNDWAAQISAMVSINQVDKKRVIGGLIGEQVLKADANSVRSIIREILHGYSME